VIISSKKGKPKNEIEKNRPWFVFYC